MQAISSGVTKARWISCYHQLLFEGKASQRTRQFGSLALPTTESWSLGLLTLNPAALLEIRSAPTYHRYFQYLKWNTLDITFFKQVTTFAETDSGIEAFEADYRSKVGQIWCHLWAFALPLMLHMNGVISSNTWHLKLSVVESLMLEMNDSILKYRWSVVDVLPTQLWGSPWNNAHLWLWVGHQNPKLQHFEKDPNINLVL